MNNIFDLFDIDAISVLSTDIDFSDSKLNPSFYSSNQVFIKNIDTKPLINYCDDVFMGPIFKRDSVINPEFGVRFLASNEIVLYDPKKKYITKEQAIKLNLIVKKNSILITRYGTIGSMRIVDSIIDEFAVADNVTRIIPKQNIGFIACFLSSSFGQKLLNDYSSGSSVKFIQAPQISQIPIPILTNDIVSRTNDLYLEAIKCREEAYKLLENSKQLVLKYNNLPPLEDTELETLDPDKETDLRLVSTKEFTDDYRLDAHFYNPMADLVVRNIKDNSSGIKLLSEVTESVFMCNRFTRNYVEKEQGLPFLSGKNIIQIRPDLKFISLTETFEIEELIVQKEWCLITRSGTLGRVGFVWSNYENYTATEDIIRVVPRGFIDSGYLYALLSSEYGYHQILRYKHGAVIDHITPEQIGDLLIPIPGENQQKEIGDLVRKAYNLRAEAILLEDEAQKILTKELTGK